METLNMSSVTQIHQRIGSYPPVASSSSSSTNLQNILQQRSSGECTAQSTQSECAACHKPIKERFLLKALDQLWHEDCLKCACCDCRLGEVGSTLFTKANLILCKRDYLRLFGNTGMCSACNRIIPAFEMVMRAPGDRVYHLECFQCSHCNHRFCIGDRFHLHENRILCEYDYEEFISVMGNNESNSGPILGDDSVAPIAPVSDDGPEPNENSKPQDANNAPQVNNPRRARHPLDQDNGSSGYGSPDSVLSDGK